VLSHLSGFNLFLEHMKRVATIVLAFCLVTIGYRASAQVMRSEILGPSLATHTTSVPVMRPHSSEISPVFLSGSKGAAPLASTVKEADSNYTDTTSADNGGNGWYLFNLFGDTTESVTLNQKDTTITLYFCGAGERFTTSLKSARIDSVAFTFVPFSFNSTDSLTVKVVPIWDRPTTTGQVLPFINYYGQNPVTGQTVPTWTMATAKFPADSITSGPTFNTLTARFGAGGKSLLNNKSFAVVVQVDGPGRGTDTIGWQAEALLNGYDPNYAIDTNANRSYFLELTNDNFVESQGWAVDVPQVQNGSRTGQAYFGNFIMIAYVHGTSSGVTNSDLPGYSLANVYPNPVSGSTTFSYELGKIGPVSLKVYNSIGEEVATVVNSTQGTGAQNATFDASKLANGMYYYTLRSGDFVATQSMIVSH